MVLEFVEIVDGAILLLVYLALTLFVPLALLGVVAGFFATLVNLPFEWIAPGAARGERRGALFRLARAFFRIVAWSIGIAAVLAVIAGLVGRFSSDPGQLLREGARLLVVAVVQVQDAGMRAWTGLGLGEVLARTAAADGLRPLGVFAALVAARVYDGLRPDVALGDFRWIFAVVVGSIALAFVGLSPLRLIPSLRLPSPALPRRAPAVPAPRPGEVLSPAPRRAVARGQGAATASHHLAVVSPRAEVTRLAMARLAWSGFERTTAFLSLQDLGTTRDRTPPDVVFIDARVLRWGSPLPAELLRRAILLVDPTEQSPPDASRYAAVLRTDALPDEYGAAARLVLVAQRDARTA